MPLKYKSNFITSLVENPPLSLGGKSKFLTMALASHELCCERGHLQLPAHCLTCFLSGPGSSPFCLCHTPGDPFLLPQGLCICSSGCMEYSSWRCPPVPFPPSSFLHHKYSVKTFWPSFKNWVLSKLYFLSSLSVLFCTIQHSPPFIFISCIFSFMYTQAHTHIIHLFYFVLFPVCP